jgi:DNA-binding FadR family transcriptional regulator
MGLAERLAMTIATPLLRRAGRTAGHDEIAATLGGEILSGTRAPGSRLPSPDELFDRFGASRMLLREVTKTLAAKGLITAKTRIGTQVLAPEHWNWFDPDILTWRAQLGFDKSFLHHLAQMRRAVEPAAAALAAQNRTDAHLADMRRALAAMGTAGTDRRTFAEADLDFHISVATASGNPLFRSFAGVVETALGAYFSLSTPIESAAMGVIVARHAEIVDAIEANDPDAAARRMLAVINQGVERLIPEPA